MGSNSVDKLGNVDNFGTYLNEIRGSTMIERILDRASHGSVTLGALVKELDGNPQDVVSALVKAEELGFVRLEKHSDETVVIPLRK